MNDAGPTFRAALAISFSFLELVKFIVSSNLKDQGGVGNGEGRVGKGRWRGGKVRRRVAVVGKS